MITFIIFFTVFVSLNTWVWLRTLSVARATGVHPLWRRVFSAWVILMLLGLMVLLLLPRLVKQDNALLPQWVIAPLYIWHILILPIVAIGLLIAGTIARIRRRKVELPTKEPSPQSGYSRRQVLTMAAMAAPPLAAISLARVSAGQIGKFKVTHYDLALPGWPASLNGFTIGVVADVHTGVFTTAKMLRDVVDTANNLHADLMLLPGDLINLSLSDLPSALDMVMKLDARHGVYMVQGNHDLLQSEAIFNRDTKARGVPLLLDEAISLRRNGIPIQLLGTRWPGKHVTTAGSVATVVQLRDPDAFPILMAHHPHTWDDAVAHGLPFVISGHTHGGQIMLTKNIGGGPLRFKYWTGLYQKPGSSLLVSNGVGNWFPLRMNAPAEILKITMHGMG